MENINWSSLLWAIAAVVASVSVLMKTMSSSYGGIISHLQNEIKVLREELEQDRKDCAVKLAKLQKQMDDMTAKMCPGLTTAGTCPLMILKAKAG